MFNWRRSNGACLIPEALPGLKAGSVYYSSLMRAACGRYCSSHSPSTCRAYDVFNSVVKAFVQLLGARKIPSATVCLKARKRFSFRELTSENCLRYTRRRKASAFTSAELKLRIKKTNKLQERTEECNKARKKKRKIGGRLRSGLRGKRDGVKGFLLRPAVIYVLHFAHKAVLNFTFIDCDEVAVVHSHRCAWSCSRAISRRPIIHLTAPRHGAIRLALYHLPNW